MKKLILCYTLLLLSMTFNLFAQTPATFSYPVAVGRTSTCGSGTAEIHYYTYNGGTNTITNAAGGPVAPCVPQLRIGGLPGGTQRFTANLASVSFNPRDHRIYYFWTALSGTLAIGGIPRTYAWSWPVGTCPGTAANKLDTIRSFPADILGVAFDNNGNGFILEFTNALPTVPVTFKPMLRSINFTTGALGAADTLAVTGGAKVYVTGNGDVAMSPSGQMFFVVNNKLFTPNYQAYTGTGANLTCTYIDTVRTSNNFVGLTYADGESVAAFSGGTCPFETIDLMTAVNLPIIKNTAATVRSAVDLATIISGVGAAKKLISVVPTGVPQQYDVVYEIVVKNYGTMDVNNLQVREDLTQINGAGNVSNVSVTFPVNPMGYTVNPAYNGVGPLATNFNILAGTPTLPNYPVASGTFTIRISLRLNNIQTGVIYYNRAVVTARDFNNNNLSDSSTNGDMPDLNGNDKPDDAPESQPTPLLVTVAAVTPPCNALNSVLYQQTFGTGTTLTTTIPIPTLPAGKLGPGNSDYAGSVTAPLGNDRYTLTNNANNANTSHWISQGDHTGNANGRMLLINADANNTVFYRDTIATLCGGQQYSLFFFAAFVGNGNYQTLCDGFGGFRYPRIQMNIRDRVTGLIITQLTTTDISSTIWTQYGLKFVMPTGFSNVIFELTNAGLGGCGNDIAIDDIQFGICDAGPTVTVNPAGGCIGVSATFTSALSDSTALPGSAEYQWQVATALAGPYVNIAGATSSTYTIPAVAAADTGKFYRILVAATGNIAIATCRYTSPGMKLDGRAPSIAATSISRDKNNICAGISVLLTRIGGSLGANASWRWYSGSCSGTSIGTGTTISVMPSVTTTYYVRAEGDCNTTICQSITITIVCDIDKDNDGIPDYVESNMIIATADTDGDGTSNAFDLDYPGFVDINNDHINDNFQADGDSDNDGIQNYLDPTFPGRIDTNADGRDDRFDMDLDGMVNMLDLDSDNDGIPDVVEAGGVDANGDGRIDNYTDTDNDGFSQNVDINNTGARISGVGLGTPDPDADTRPNALDRDSDGDGIPDVVEAAGPDANNDAIIDGFADTNNDGLADAFIFATGLLRTGADINADGRADSYPFKNFDNDRRANPYDVDSDMDGIVDVIEAGFTDANADGFIDGAISADGWNTALHALGSLNLRNTDNRAGADYLDIDSDDDGIPDNIEGMTTAGYSLPSFADADVDGLDNNYDNSAAFGGRGVVLSDKDLDGLPDYRDLDTDADGQPDIVEGNDFNMNGTGWDDNTTPTLLDADGDGLDNRFDSINSVLNIRGTSYNMGTGGSTTGDPAPGTRAPVQKQVPAQIDRDWRFVGAILDLQLLQFNVIANNNNAALTWKITSPVSVDRFEIERSTDNLIFTKVGEVTQAIPLNTIHQLGYDDDISGLSSGMIWYRIKIIASDGQVKYSNVVLVRLTKQTTVTVYPNPATHEVSIRFNAEAASEATIRITDSRGRKVMMFNQKILKGDNNIIVHGLDRLSQGIYILELRSHSISVIERLSVK